MKKKNKTLKKNLLTAGIVTFVVGLLIFLFSFANFGAVATDKDSYTVGDNIRFSLADILTAFYTGGISKCDNAVAEIILISHTTNQKVYFQSSSFILTSDDDYKAISFVRQLEDSKFQISKKTSYDIEGRFLCLDNGVKQLSPTSYGFLYISPKEVCKTNTERRCVGSSIYWYDSCGTKGDLYKTCSSDQYCSDAQCIAKTPSCNPKSYKECYEESIYWYDSCGKIGDLVESCDSDQYCSDGQCFNNPSDPGDPGQPQVCGDQPSPPCTEATWQDYPLCQWDTDSCPFGCTEDLAEDCADGSTIITKECINGELSDTSNSCPTVVCNDDSDCSEDFSCILNADGSTECKYSQVDTNPETFDESTNKGIKITGIVIMVLAGLMLLISLFIRGKK